MYSSCCNLHYSTIISGFKSVKLPQQRAKIHETQFDTLGFQYVSIISFDGWPPLVTCFDTSWATTATTHMWQMRQDPPAQITQSQGTATSLEFCWRIVQDGLQIDQDQCQKWKTKEQLSPTSRPLVPFLVRIGRPTVIRVRKLKMQNHWESLIPSCTQAY